MKRRDLGMLPSTFAAAVAEVGDAWTLLIVKELILGTNRFDGFIAQTGIAESSLAQRLKTMEQSGLITRRAYQTNPVRYEYALTPKGDALAPTLIMLMKWGDQFLSDGAPPCTYECLECGNDPQPHPLACNHCGTEITAKTAKPILSETALAARAQRTEDFQKKKSERNAA